MSEFPATRESQDNSMPAAFSGDSSAAQTPTSADASSDRDLVSKVISEVIASRARGERVCIEQVIASHPELMPGLRDELLALDAIHQAVVLGQPQRPTAFPVEADAHKGLRIDGYCIDREISSGGQATVFKAVQERTGRSVAIKIMHGGPFMGSRGRKRFERESKILARLNHPNVVGILDKGRTPDGSFFLVMDFVEGSDLDTFVRRLGKDTSAIVRLFVKVASAVNEAHRLGIVHRDLKPMNILVDSRGEPHVLDFGMARVLCDLGSVSEAATEQTFLTRTGQVLGSLPWTSPEQVFGSPDAVDAQSDVYALGVMLFATLAGEFPYPVKGSPRAITHHVANTPPASLTRLAQRNGMTVTGGLEEIVCKALSKSPSQRYASAGLLARDLETWLAGKPRLIARNRSRTKRWILILGLVAVLAPLPVFAPYLFRTEAPGNSKSTFINSVGMPFVRIPAGAVFISGLKDPREIDLYNAPSYRVDDAFYLSATVVTQEQYLRVTRQNPAYPDQKEHALPVQCVTWDDATAFCDALSKREHRAYRLPTQSEWMYAFYSGISDPLTQDQLDRLAWYAGNSDRHLHPVATKRPDRRGLYDMIGNVRQWCSIPPVRYSNSTTGVSAIDQSLRLADGADFLTPASECLAPSRLKQKYPPETSLPTIGFRVVCESPQQH
jgi:serine/threonine-protein kinase